MKEELESKDETIEQKDDVIKEQKIALKKIEETVRDKEEVVTKMKDEINKVKQEKEQMARLLLEAENMLAQVSEPTRRPNFKSSSSEKQVNATDSNTTQVEEEKRIN